MYCKLLKIQKRLETLQIEQGDLVYFRFEIIRNSQKTVIRPLQIYNVNRDQEISIQDNFDCMSQLNNFQFGVDTCQIQNSKKKVIVLQEKSQLKSLENEFQNLFISSPQQFAQEDQSIKALTQQMQNLFLGDKEISSQEIQQSFIEFKLS